jgi:hypothetical protein
MIIEIDKPKLPLRDHRHFVPHFGTRHRGRCQGDVCAPCNACIIASTGCAQRMGLLARSSMKPEKSVFGAGMKGLNL